MGTWGQIRGGAQHQMGQEGLGMGVRWGHGGHMGTRQEQEPNEGRGETRKEQGPEVRAKWR